MRKLRNVKELLDPYEGLEDEKLTNDKYDDGEDEEDQLEKRNKLGDFEKLKEKEPTPIAYKPPISFPKALENPKTL